MSHMIYAIFKQANLNLVANLNSNQKHTIGQISMSACSCMLNLFKLSQISLG
jgi:hypothetical protein